MMHVCSAGVLKGTTGVWALILILEFTITHWSMLAVIPANKTEVC